MTYIKYHVGDLRKDSERDPLIRSKAEEYRELGTPLGEPIFPWMGEDSPRGLGEGYLVQKKLWTNIYEYRFYPKAGHNPII